MSKTAQKDPLLEAVEKRLGFVPNLVQEMARAPAALKAYMAASEALDGGLLSPPERQTAMLAASAHNGCRYCLAAHSKGGKLAGIAEADLAALAGGRLPEDAKLKAVAAAVRMVMEKKGWLKEGDLKSLEALGIDRPRLYEITALVALKTLSNYVNHIAHTEIDPQFK